MASGKKIYVMSVACSGKSIFAKQNEYCAGLKVVDFAELLPTPKRMTWLILYLSRVLPRLRYFVRRDRSVLAKQPKHYYAKIFSYIRSESEPIVVLGRPAPESLEGLSDIEFAAVLIPREEHERNCRARRREHRNPFPFFHHWTTDFAKIELTRARLESYARRHNIPVYDSFRTAIMGVFGRRLRGENGTSR